METGQRLLILGAGPKAMAIASKAYVLRSHGISVPEIHIVERREVGANWSGRFGYTDGRQLLGTSPEKDVGFPYQSSCWGEASAGINRRMAAFSWHSFLQSRGRYAEWVDRGRPAPEHRHWAEYLKWVCDQVGEGVFFHQGEVTRVDLSGDRWVVTFEREGESRTLGADGLVLTGPARERRPEGLGGGEYLHTVESFWTRYQRFREVKGTVAVVGTGENAACIVSTLASLRNPDLRLEVWSPRGMVYTRGENFPENRVYTDPETAGWGELSERDRREFIGRTDRGVFSVQAQRLLNEVASFRVRAGRLVAVEP